jgi:hypothetical protein
VEALSRDGERFQEEIEGLVRELTVGSLSPPALTSSSFSGIPR